MIRSLILLLIGAYLEHRAPWACGLAMLLLGATCVWRAVVWWRAV